jgi:cytochrome b
MNDETPPTSDDLATWRPVPVWDLPIRLFHWCVVLLIGTSWATVETDHLVWHRLSGYAIMTALIFRILWGLFGSETARFVRFMRSPFAALRHLAHFGGKRGPDAEIGHNAAGGWMVLTLLGLLVFQVGTGLFANSFDGEDVNGPLAHIVPERLSNRMTDLHAQAFNVILAAVSLHLLAIAAYAVFKRHNLTGAMLTGRKRLPRAVRPPHFAGPVRALVTLAVAVGLTVTIASFGGG